MSQLSSPTLTYVDTPVTPVRTDGVSASPVRRLSGAAAGEVEQRTREASQSIRPSRYFTFKPTAECVVTVALGLVALPVMAIIALAILVSDGRPVFYRQSRVGREGRPFRIWKFRTMRRDAEQQTGPVWSCKADDRVTPLGRWLRLSHADELPQIINVLSGEMSLVGPRPERPEFVRQLAREVPNYTQRLQVRPGITGLAQLVLGYDQCVADVRRKVALDLQYIRTASLARDVGLLFRTLPCIVSQLMHRRPENQLPAQRPEAPQRPGRGLAVVPPAIPQERRSDNGRPGRVVPRRRRA